MQGKRFRANLFLSINSPPSAKWNLTSPAKRISRALFFLQHLSPSNFSFSPRARNAARTLPASDQKQPSGSRSDFPRECKGPRHVATCDRNLSRRCPPLVPLRVALDNERESLCSSRVLSQEISQHGEFALSFAHGFYWIAYCDTIPFITPITCQQ